MMKGKQLYKFGLENRGKDKPVCVVDNHPMYVYWDWR
jgi:hypothetical protein